MKETFEVIHFKFKAPLHLSNVRADYGLSEKLLHSDTLYSAIMHTWAVLGKEEWINPKPDFAISSLFPFTRDLVTGQPVHFFVKPYFQANIVGESSPSDAKKFKKIQYVDQHYFEHYLNFSPIESNLASIKGIYQTSGVIDPHFMSVDVQQRIKRPRNEQEDTVPFYMERIYFKEGSGLFCLARFENPEAKKRVIAALKLLAENGIGTDRAVGNGQFEVDFGIISLSMASPATYAMNLSLYCPDSKEELSGMLEGSRVRYEIIKRGGWMSEPYNTYRKRSVYMFREGSVFKIQSNETFSKGKTVNLQPEPLTLPIKVETPVWRVGKALFLPVNL